MHARFSPRPHRFLYRIFLFAIDLDELPLLHRNLALFSFGRRNLYSFRDGDYLPTGEPLHHAPLPPATSDAPLPHRAPETGNLKSRVLAHLAASSPTLDLTGARVVLVTLPRVFGYLFNPVSFYFCYDRTGTPIAALSEVTNTFKEMKPYVLGPATRTNATPPTSHFHPSTGEGRAGGATFTLRTPKHFYVSPFSDVDVAFDFALRTPGKNLSVQIDDYVGTERTLTSTLAGPRSELTGARLAWFTLKYPALTLRIIALIHLHAALLWCKRVPWFAKSARSADQRALYRPHSSIVRSATTLSSAHPSEAL